VFVLDSDKKERELFRSTGSNKSRVSEQGVKVESDSIYARNAPAVKERNERRTSKRRAITSTA